MWLNRARFELLALAPGTRAAAGLLFTPLRTHTCNSALRAWRPSTSFSMLPRSQRSAEHAPSTRSVVATSLLAPSTWRSKTWRQR